MIAVAVIYFVWKYRHELYKGWLNFLKELRELWARLFGGKPSESDTETAEVVMAEVVKPFRSFGNPFRSGGTLNPAAVVRHTFGAFVAWARERGCAKDVDDTPLEFAQSVGDNFEVMADNSRQLAAVYCRLAYDEEFSPSDGDIENLKGLWAQMETANER